MNSKKNAQERIRDVLATEKDSITLSERLFSQGGLFSHLAHTKAERKKLVRSPLFRKALDRFQELQEEEAEAFLLGIAQAQRRKPSPAGVKKRRPARK